MNKTKQSFLPYLLSFIAAILLMSGIFAVNASAIIYTYGDFVYYYDSAFGNKVTILGYTGTDTEVVIPSHIESHPVTAIGAGAFEGCSLESITIPNTVESIGGSAFKDCCNLKSINIPNGVESIEYETFQGCSSLGSIIIPNSVTSIGENAFYYCFGLKSVTLPDNLAFIDSFAFYSCYGLESLTIPQSVYTISDNAFNGCYSLKSLTISNGVDTIEEKAFANCDGLTSITIPDSVTSIGDESFSGCNITSIDIPDNVAYIGKAPFSGLSEYKVSSSNANYCSKDGVLFDKSMETLAAYPSGKKASAYSIPDTVTSIRGSAFAGCSLTRITMPNSVTSVDRGAFDFCWDLKDVYYSGSSSDWEKIVINEYKNDDLLNATIHYNITGITEISEIELSVDFSKISPVKEGDAFPAVTKATVCGGHGSDEIINVKTPNLEYTYNWAVYNNGEWIPVDTATKFTSDDIYGFILSCVVTDAGNTAYVFDSDLKITGYDSDKCTRAAWSNTKVAYAIKLGTINDINNAGGSSEEEHDIENFVERLYIYILGRPSEPEGKANHVANLRNGESAVKVAFDFVYSEEFRNLNLSNEEITERLYRTFLDRAPEEEGLAYWKYALDNGCTIGRLFYGFTQSAEFSQLCEKYGIVRGEWAVTEARDKNPDLTAFVYRLYTKALNRTYDVDGLNYHTAKYIENHDIYQLAYDFIFSEEFNNRQLSDEDFVDTMYYTFFDRAPDADGRAEWLSKLKGGASREEILAGFVGSQECANLVAKFGI